MQGTGKVYLSVNYNDKQKQFWSIKYERNNTSFLRHINFYSFNNFRESVLLLFFLEKQAERLRDVTSLAQSYTVGMLPWHTNWLQVCLPPSPGFFSRSSFSDVQVFSSLVRHNLWWNNSQAPSQVRIGHGTTDWFQ